MGQALSYCQPGSAAVAFGQMQRFAAILFAVYMLAHACVPVLPTYVCTDGGRSLSPCSPIANEAPPNQAEWNLADCCKLTAAATVDARPPVSTNASYRVAVLVAILPLPQTALFVQPPPWRPDHLGRGDPVLRGPPQSSHTVLRI